MNDLITTPKIEKLTQNVTIKAQPVRFVLQSLSSVTTNIALLNQIIIKFIS